MIVVWICETCWILQDLTDAGNELVKELSPLSVVEKRPTHRCQLHQTRKRRRR